MLSSCKNTNLKDDSIKFNDEEHTYSNIDSVRTKHLSWVATVDFARKQVNGTATWSFENKGHSKFIHFDTYDLTIKNITVNGRKSNYYQTPFMEEYGSGLSIPIQDGDSIVSIEYNTGREATALQWLAPEQTAGKKMPYLFTQCESIHARSLIPCQDAPKNRITYDAKLTVPKGMLALMSAKNPTQKNEEGIYDFKMDIPVPTYLIAMAIGDIEYKAIDARSGVYTEPSMLQACADELSDIPSMIAVAEKLGGPYRWGKYDVLIAPPSFPIGGMENPILTFATPTIIAGDKSLVSLIAHELAHSWSGNLVTNANWNDLWLNEGFTTYFEKRIMENISDRSYVDMLWELDYQDLQNTLKDLGNDNPDTRLRVDLKGRHPGDAFSDIPYVKGAYFLRMLEENLGRAKFDAFLNQYFNHHAFTPTNTANCLAFMDQHLFGGDTLARNKLKVREWIFGTGLPDNCPHVIPQRFETVNTLREEFEKSSVLEPSTTQSWTTHEWLQFLRKLPRPTSITQLSYLDSKYSLSQTKNSEIACEWYKLGVASNYESCYVHLETFLARVGRKKFLEPLYMELLKNSNTNKKAATIFEKSKSNYHPQTAEKIGGLFTKKSK